MNTPTITITDLADVRAGDMVTAEYVPPASVGEFGATIIGQASATYNGGLVVGSHHLRFEDGAACDALRFISATREVPAWKPGEDEVRYLAQALAAPMPETASTDWQAQATHLLTHMHDNGWRKDDLTEPEPVDPVLDETDKRDRLDLDGYKWQWSGNAEVWQLGVHNARGNLAVLDRDYGPLKFADEETEA